MHDESVLKAPLHLKGTITNLSQPRARDHFRQCAGKEIKAESNSIGAGLDWFSRSYWRGWREIHQEGLISRAHLEKGPQDQGRQMDTNLADGRHRQPVCLRQCARGKLGWDRKLETPRPRGPQWSVCSSISSPVKPRGEEAEAKASPHLIFPSFKMMVPAAGWKMGARKYMWRSTSCALTWGGMETAGVWGHFRGSGSKGTWREKGGV